MSDPAPEGDGYHHDVVRIPAAYVDPAGWPVEHRLLGGFLGAVLEGCDPCAEALFALLAETP